MSEPWFQTLDELATEFPRLKLGKKLHRIAEERLATLLQDIWPDAYAKPEPGEMPAGRSDLAFYFADGRYAVFEIFATVSQVPQDLRHLEQSAAEARIAVLTDPVLDKGAIYKEYYAKKPRNPFPVLDLSEILVAGNQAAAKRKLKQYIDEAFASEQEVTQSLEALASRLAVLSLDDVSREDFGENTFTAGVARLDSRYVILAAIPLQPVACSPTNVLRAARTMLDPAEWYKPTPDDHPPRYWPHSIFKVPQRRRSDRNALFWEDPAYGSGSATGSRLAVTDRAEVFFVSSERPYFVTTVGDDTGVFLLGRIVAECWKLSGLVAQLYHDIGHSGKTQLCIAMVGTNATYLGGFAGRYLEPSDPRYWFQAISGEHPWTCHAPNLVFSETVGLLSMEPKKQPRFVNDFAEAISLAYNHDEPRCFDKETGLIPEAYLEWT